MRNKDETTTDPSPAKGDDVEGESAGGGGPGLSVTGGTCSKSNVTGPKVSLWLDRSGDTCLQG